MADYAPMRTGQLVVRRQASRRGQAALIGGAILILVLFYGMFEWGRWQAGYSKLADVRARREMSSQMEGLVAENEKLRGRLAAADLAREVERKSYADVEKTLADLQAQVLKHREELAFYRGIVSPEDGIGGLRLQRIQVLQGAAERHYRLHLVLVQSMRQDAVVSGTVNVTVEGVQDERPVELGLVDLRDGENTQGQVPFQFRYFQNLEQDIVLPPGFEPKAVNVEIRSARQSPVRESHPWQVHIES